MIHGSCLCGGIGWTASGPFELMAHCHCSMCRKAHGASFATALGAPRTGFRFERGADQVVRYASSPRAVRGFCATCGSTVPTLPEQGEQVFLPAGCLDNDPGVRPMAHIFVASRAPWHEIRDSLPCFDAYPSGYGDEQTTPRVADPSVRAADAVRGSCLCQHVAFEAVPPFGPMTNCHCSRCRKMVAAAYATDFRAPIAGFRWLRGREHVRDFVLPGAKWFLSSFCNCCGAALPHVARNAPDFVLIQAGALDDDPGIRPLLHLFVGSKAPWEAIDDALPQYDAYPPSSA